MDDIRELCPYIIIKEEESDHYSDPNNPFDVRVRCKHLKSLRELSPQLDEELGKIASVCGVISSPELDWTQWPHWCPTSFTYRDLQWAAYHAYKGKYPELEKVHRCSICGVPIVLDFSWGDKWNGELCHQCYENTYELNSQPKYLLGQAAQIGENEYIGGEYEL